MWGILLDWAFEAVFGAARAVGARVIGAWRGIIGRPAVPPSDVAEWFVGFAVIVAAGAGLLTGLSMLGGDGASLGADAGGAP